MRPQSNKIQYFLYARKSSETEDRQVLSIDSQTDELKKIATQEGLTIVRIFTEARSAKEPGRPIFNEMLERIKKGEADGILCWKLDRLARNPIDGAEISWWLQRGAIKHIQTYGRSYYPTDNVLMMSVEFGMANQFIIDLSTNVKRGLRKKAEMGCYPTHAPVGYINNPLKTKGSRDIVKDEGRFALLRKMFEMVHSGTHTPPKVLKMASSEWGFTMPNGKPMARSTFYRILTDPFYYGRYEYPKGSGEWYQGTHEPLITETEYDRVQILLGRRGNPRPKTHVFAFTGLMRCGECGCTITAEEKVKRQKNGNIHHYIYYHCTKRKNTSCSQGSIEVKELEAQILHLLGTIEIPQEFYEWALEVIKSENIRESEIRGVSLENQRHAYDACTKRIDSLIDMRANEEITQEEFLAKKNTILKEKERLHAILTDTDEKTTGWLERAEKLFTFARDAAQSFNGGTTQVKRNILTALGSNLTLKDEKLSVVLHDSLSPIIRCAAEVKNIHARLEPPNTAMDKKEIERLYAQSPTLLPG